MTWCPLKQYHNNLNSISLKKYLVLVDSSLKKYVLLLLRNAFFILKLSPNICENLTKKIHQIFHNKVKLGRADIIRMRAVVSQQQCTYPSKILSLNESFKLFHK